MSQWLFEISVDDLLTRTINAFPATTKRQHDVNSVSVVNMEAVPATDALLIKATVRGSEGDEYSTVIEFLDVEYNPEDRQEVVSFAAAGKEYKITPIQRTKAKAKVGCNCLDFKFRFSFYNNNHGALHGNDPFLYTRVPGSNRPPANPQQSPGLCKHIIDLADELNDTGLLQ